MMFKAKADNKFLIWEDGKVSGDRMSKSKAILIASKKEGTEVGPFGGPYTYNDHLADPISAAIIFRQVLGERDIRWSGELPIREHNPKEIY